MNDPKKILPAIIYFILSTAITWWFVDVCPLYESLQQKLLSTGIAGTKWCLQIAAAFFFLTGKRWAFIKNIGFTCLIGSLILLPYAILASFSYYNSTTFFVSSLLTAVMVMIGLYYWSVKRSALPYKWFWGWINLPWHCYNITTNRCIFDNKILMMAVIIRRAVKEDCARMMELIRELAAYEKAPDEVTVDFDHFVDSGFGEKPVWWAFVAEQNGRIEGFAMWYIRYSTWKGQRLYLEDLIVTEKMRGKGIGKLLFEQLIEECKAKKYSGMMWQVLDWNEPAINFYKKYPNVKFDAEWLNCSINF